MNKKQETMDNALEVRHEPLKEVPVGYKRTEVGVIPQSWEVRTLEALGEFKNGINKDKQDFGHGFPFVNLMDVFGIPKVSTNSNIGLVNSSLGERETYALQSGDVLFVRSSVKPEGVGLTTLILEDLPNTVFSGFLIRYRDKGVFALEFKEHCFHEAGFRSRLIASSTVSANTNISQGSLKSLKFAFPPNKSEQRAIAEALSDVDGLLAALDALIAKKRAIKQAAMQQLLTGKTRLPGFSGTWETKKISEVATYCNEKNSLAENLPVLTCSKHLGFVDSLSYFKNQIFSKDLSGYKIIKRGQIGYPANHIEEGSIGLQDIYDVALVSPIYVVCSPKEGINSYFLHRLLKLDRYRQEFAIATTSSVDRRGSLRWPIFSELVVNLPYIDEQEAIAAVLSDMDTEIAVLERRLDKTKAIKQGMMQELLTGRVRLVQSETTTEELAEARPVGRKHNWQFNEAVVISVLAKHFGNEQYPLGRMRYTKLSYLLHRHKEGYAEGYLKKAAGPYNPQTRYGGPEKIALQKDYVRQHRSGKGQGFITSTNVDEAERYFDKWYRSEALQWLEQFRYKTNNELELLTTVDMAVAELCEAGEEVSVECVKKVIRSHPEWNPKLDRPIFSDANLAGAIESCQKLFEY